MPSKILIVDDHDDFRLILRKFLENQNLGVTIWEVPSAEMAVEFAKREEPEIVLMDIRLPNMNGIDAAGQIKQFLPQCTIIILTVFETESFRTIFKSKDISAYIGKSELFEKLIPTLRKFIDLGNG